MLLLDIVMIFICAIMLEYSGSKFREKRSVWERILDTGILFLSATVIALIIDKWVANFKL